LVWVSRSGKHERLSFPTRRRGTFEASPDGTRLAVIEESGASADLWIYDMEGLHPQQLTMSGNSYGPILWSADGKRIVFHKTQPGSRTPYVQSIDAGGVADPLLAPGEGLEIQSWSSDGQLLGANGFGSDRQEGIWVIDRTTGERHSISTAGGHPWGTAVSPDGRVVAYTSDETGEYHIFAQPFPPTGLRKQVSRVGGSEEPRWSRDGTRLFYRSGQRIMEVKIRTKQRLSVGAPTVFFQGDFVNVGGRSYDVAPDMRRVLIIEGGASGTNTLKVVQGWFAELQTLVPNR
jgi:Tol biopolymer transport system component